MRNETRERMLALLDGMAGKAGYYVGRIAAAGGPGFVRGVGRALTIVDSTVPSDSFNCVIVRDLRGLEDEGAREIAGICADFNAAGRPAAWWTCDGLREQFVAPELEKHHFIEDETDVGMLADLASIPQAVVPAGFEIRLVNSAEGVLEFGGLLASLTDAHTLAYYTAISRLDGLGSGPMRLFLGFFQGRAVGTASLFLDGETGHIFDVSTSDALRGRGLGTAMMRAVLEYARDTGARRVGLQASEEGLGVYRRMGFEEVCVFRVYSNKGHIARTGRS